MPSPRRQVTEEELGATRAVVAEQEVTERALLSEAEQTKRSLALAEEDIEGLCAKVARQARHTKEREVPRKLCTAKEVEMW